MKYLQFLLISLFFSNDLLSQDVPSDNSRFVIGISGPELVHAGITYRIANRSQVGFNAGVGPSWGTIWTALSLEHRLYFGPDHGRSQRKTLFFRQGTTFFPGETAPQRFTLNLTLGKDFLFKNPRNGITIDLGVFYQAESERSSLLLIRQLNLLPALRFELFFGL